MRSYATIEITTFRGDYGAIHWYGKLSWMKDGEFYQEELKRPIKQSEIDNRPDRFRCYKDGDMINAFNHWLTVVKVGKEIYDKHGLTCKLSVSGVPNQYRTISYEEAIDPNLDMFPRCIMCNKVIVFSKGCYNTPKGLCCCECYER